MSASTAAEHIARDTFFLCVDSVDEVEMQDQGRLHMPVWGVDDIVFAGINEYCI